MCGASRLQAKETQSSAPVPVRSHLIQDDGVSCTGHHSRFHHSLLHFALPKKKKKLGLMTELMWPSKGPVRSATFSGQLVPTFLQQIMDSGAPLTMVDFMRQQHVAEQKVRDLCMPCVRGFRRWWGKLRGGRVRRGGDMPSRLKGRARTCLPTVPVPLASTRLRLTCERAWRVYTAWHVPGSQSLLPAHE